MLVKPNNWDSLWKRPGTMCRYKISIGGVDYTSQEDIEYGSLRLKRSLFSAKKLIGNAPCFSLDCCLRNKGVIPRGAQLTLYIKLVNGADSTSFVSLGDFKVYKRVEHGDGWTKLLCRDKMQMANQPYVPSSALEDIWPKSMLEILQDTTKQLGITLDPRSNIQMGDSWVIPSPLGYSIRKIWGYIAAAHGGNFCLTPNNTLLLTHPKISMDRSSIPTEISLDGIQLLGNEVTVDRLTFRVNSNYSVASGTSGAQDLSIDCPYANQTIVNYAKSILSGGLYKPLSLNDAVSDPLMDIFDVFDCQGSLTTWSSMSLDLGISPTYSAKAEAFSEPPDEYGFEDTPLNSLKSELNSEFFASINEFSTQINKSLEGLQDQIDGQIQSFFGDYIPRTDNLPAKDWITEIDRAKHLGDLFYISGESPKSGQVYRWGKRGDHYDWILIEDNELALALEKASKALDTADHKRRVFTRDPYPPYDPGDLWSQGPNGQLMVCKNGRTSGNYTPNDWQRSCDYVNSEESKQIAKGEVNNQTQQDIFNKLTNNGKIQGLYLSDGQLYINASYIKSGDLVADLITSGILQSPDEGKTFMLDLDKGILKGNFESFSIGGKDLSGIGDMVSDLRVGSEAISASVSELRKDSDTLNSSATNTQDSIDNINAELESLRTSVSAQITSSQVQFDISESIRNSKEELTRTTGITLDEKGVTVDKSDSTTKANISDAGLSVVDSGEIVLTADRSGVDARNLRATTYLILGGRIRFQNYSDDRVACFWIGG